MKGRRERKEERRNLSLSLAQARSLALSKHRSRQMRRTRDRIERGGPRAYVPAHRGMRATHSRSKRDQARRVREGEGDAFRGTKFRDFDERKAIRGTAAAAPRVARVSTRKQERPD